MEDSCGYQDPERYVLDDRTGQPDRLSPTDNSIMDYVRSWSSQQWKSEAAAHERSGKPDENFLGYDATSCPSS